MMPGARNPRHPDPARVAARGGAQAREGVAARRERALMVVDALAKAYPQSHCALRHANPFQLLVATVLSAQTTDAAVNAVTARLFARWPDAAALAAAPLPEVGDVLHPIGLWRAKAAHIVALSALLVERHRGLVPADLEALVDLPGVGRKTATAVLGTAFGQAAGLTVDTHMLRIHHLLGLSRQTDPEGMARDLERLIPAPEWATYTHRIIDHGRIVCVARRPRCGACPLSPLCPSAGKPSIGYKPANDEALPASAAAASWLSNPPEPAPQGRGPRPNT